MKEIYYSNDEVDIRFVMGLLEENGIKVSVTADGVGGYLRTLGGDYGIMKSLKVGDGDFEKAKNILEENNIKKQPTQKHPNYIRVVAWIALAILLAGIIYSIINGMQ